MHRIEAYFIENDRWKCMQIVSNCQTTIRYHFFRHFFSKFGTKPWREWTLIETKTNGSDSNMVSSKRCVRRKIVYSISCQICWFEAPPLINISFGNKRIEKKKPLKFSLFDDLFVHNTVPTNFCSTNLFRPKTIGLLF